jgi:hypothetical protein
MTLEIIKTVRQAIEHGEPLKQSDILALVATTEQLWQQTVDTLTHRATGETRRKLYVRIYEAISRR